MEKTFIVATNNMGKLEEFRRVLEPMGFSVLTAKQAGFESIDPEENGATFAENSYIKAKAFLDLTNMPVIADDSGLCVDALDGAPGIHSARYGGDHDFSNGINRLLKELEGVPQEKRGAYFVCHICCLYPNGERLDCEGRCYGSIGYEPLGENGFGFDPVFMMPDGRSMSEISDEEKDAASHRGNALREFVKLLAEK